MPAAFMEPFASSPDRRRTKKRLLLAAALVGLLAVLCLVALNAGVPAAVGRVITALRDAGPGIFFAAMAVLPAVGFPMLAFTLAAGPVFVPTLGAGWVIAWSLAAVMVNLLLTYWLADRALRPMVGRLLTCFDIRLPDLPAGGAWQLALIVRLTPGPPFWLQSYVLGLMRVPFVPYLVVSTGVMAGCIVALVCGGAAIAQGSGRLAFTSLGVVVVTVAALQLVRQRTNRRRAAAVSVNPDLSLPAR